MNGAVGQNTGAGPQRRCIEPGAIACIKAAPMDEDGSFNFACSTTYLEAMTERAKVVIVETCGPS